MAFESSFTITPSSAVGSRSEFGRTVFLQASWAR
jgi:hypothetical protein